jgi:hypothetical protein
VFFFGHNTDRKSSKLKDLRKWQSDDVCKEG